MATINTTLRKIDVSYYRLDVEHNDIGDVAPELAGRYVTACRVVGEIKGTNLRREMHVRFMQESGDTLGRKLTEEEMFVSRTFADARTEIHARLQEDLNAVARFLAKRNPDVINDVQSEPSPEYSVNVSYVQTAEEREMFKFEAENDD